MNKQKKDKQLRSEDLPIYKWTLLMSPMIHGLAPVPPWTCWFRPKVFVQRITWKKSLPLESAIQQTLLLKEESLENKSQAYIWPNHNIKAKQNYSFLYNTSAVFCVLAQVWFAINKTGIVFCYKELYRSSLTRCRITVDLGLSETRKY